MSNRKKQRVKIVEQSMLSDGIFSIWFEAPDVALAARAGQFISIYTNDASKLLPRPISICEIDRAKGLIRVVYRVSGAGTKQFSELSTGDSLEILGPLGNGYDLEAINNNGGALCVVGGGIGIPPMLGLAKAYKEKYPENEVIAVLGYRDKFTFLTDEFESTCKVYYASDNGDIGIKGNVIDAIRAYELSADCICACGPTPMLRGLIAYANEKGVKTFISLEEKMACGIGACLACVCKSKEIDDHSHVHNKRICKDGPVFDSSEIEL
jgi:dihydroorotate dehydrogenase electron transfer subunit